MAVIQERTLESLSPSDVPQFPPSKLREVREIRRTPTLLTARLGAIRVSVSGDLEEAECSACPDVECCEHVLTALSAWTRRRKKATTPARLGLVDRLLSGPAWRTLDDLVGQVLDRSTGELDVRDDGSLKLSVRSGEREATITIPPDEAPAVLMRTPPGLTRTPRAAKVRVSRDPLTPELRADFEGNRKIAIRPVWGEGIAPREGARWHFDGKTYRALATLPRHLKSRYGKGVTIQEDDIPKFIQGEFQNLLKSDSFKPSPEVREARVAGRPSLTSLRIQDDAGDWLDLDPIYEVDDIRLAQSEILATQGKRKFIRKGNTWVPADPKKTYTGPTRVRRWDYLLQKPDLPVENDIPAFDPGHRDPVPAGLLTELRNYQRAGYDWLRYLHRAGLHGVLADDMGLGKTHQTMAFLLSLYEQKARRPSLIVAPTSVLESWIQKIRRFAPSLRPYRFYGPDRKPEALRLPGQRAIVTTYTVLARDIAWLASMDWECVVLDEAQYIKTSATQFSQAARKLNARTRLALTGTPIENRLDELWSIFHWLLPGHLGSAEYFRKKYEVPIVRQKDVFARNKLKKLIAPFKLRRVKSEVLDDLPPKVEDVRMCDLSPHQEALYRALVDKDAGALANNLRDRSQKVDYVSVFAALSRLKRVCDHPALVVEGPRVSDLESGKFEVFKEVINEALESGQKIVVFTQYLKMMDIIEEYLRSRRIGYAEIRGDTRDRAEAIHQFNTKDRCRVFVCSLMAGGVGIDLTAASVVIHYDRWWNAAREDQATDRVHRIGQRNGVQVFKLVTRGTLEEKIDLMIASKGELMNSVVDVDAKTFKKFGRDELIDLLGGARAEALAGA